MSKARAATRRLLAILAWLLLVPGIASGVGQARAADLVSFASIQPVSFPLDADSLGVEPVLFPFLPIGTVTSDSIGVAVRQVTRDGQGIDSTAFGATIAKPEGDTRPLYSVKIDSTAMSAARAIRAGKYVITVYLWEKSAGGSGEGPTGVTASESGCSVCQVASFTITRDAIQLDLSAATMLVRKGQFWLGKQADVGSLKLYETGGLSAGTVTSLDASASRSDGGETADIPAALMTSPTKNDPKSDPIDWIERGGARVVAFDTENLGPGSWTTTLRIHSDQLAANGIFSKSVTIVRKLSTVYLFLAIAFGIAAGQFVRGRLQRLQNLAAANSLGADLKVRLQTLQGIHDKTFVEVRTEAWKEIDNALKDGSKTAEQINATVASIGTRIDGAIEDFNKRRQAERQPLATLQGALRELNGDVQGLALSDLLASVSDRLDLIDATRVRQAKDAEETTTKNLAKVAVAELDTWLVKFAERTKVLQGAWPAQAELSKDLEATAAAAEKLVSEKLDTASNTFWDVLPQRIDQATSLVIGFRTALDRLWLPRVQEAAGKIARTADEASGQVLTAAVSRLVKEVAAARGAGEPSDELVEAARAVADAASKVVVGEGREPGVEPQGEGTSAGPTVQPAPQALEMKGPTRQMADTFGTWSVSSDDRNDRINWYVEDQLVSSNARELSWRFDTEGDFKIEARVVDRPEVSVSRKVGVSANPELPSRKVWQWRNRFYEGLIRAAFASVVLLSGWAVLEGTFAGWKDIFVAFIWGFGVDLTLTTVSGLRTAAIPAGLRS